MAGLTNGHAATGARTSQRFAKVPKAVDIPVSGGDAEEAVEVDLEELLDDPTELCTLLENENASKTYWMDIAMAYAKQGKLELAKEIVDRGLKALDRGRPKEKINLFNCLCWLNFVQARGAPRVIPDAADPHTKTKDYYLRESTRLLNEASRIDPSFAPTSLARGVLCLLRAALQQDQAGKTDLLRQALRAFEDVIRSSGKKNMMAYLGKARALFSLSQTAESLQNYQHVLVNAPDLVDPDPRIGIGCCFWQLGFKNDARGAWERAKQINPKSKIAHALLGLYYLDNSSSRDHKDPEFAQLYAKAILEHTQEAFRLDRDLPIANSTFAGYFLAKGGKTLDKVGTLARKAIEQTDVNAIASDGWYQLARRAHLADESEQAQEFYLKSDQARGGDDSGFLPAKLGIAQCQTQRGDFDGAKFRLERLVQQFKNGDAMVLLGTLLAEEVFSKDSTMTPEERAASSRRAIQMLEAVRSAWQDPARKLVPDRAVLLNLSQLYEAEHPEKSIRYLQQVEEMDLKKIDPEYKPRASSNGGSQVEETKEEKAARAAADAARSESLAPELLNNIACFQYHSEKLGPAQELYQLALNACVKSKDDSERAEQDALVTTISYNLARTYEAEGNMDEAKKVYQGLLERHRDYTDANVRLTYINLRQHPSGEGPLAMKALYEAHSNDLDVRSLFGWYLGKAKKRSANLAEDQEQRHHKHTLQNHDKHDKYALTAMGNLYLAHAREMRRETEAEKDKRHKMYERAVEFFNKCLELDPCNSYAAQGIAIALIDDKKDHSTALQILLRIKETIREASVYMNLGHVYCEMKQFSRAIESYEAALKKDKANDAQLLSCLGRAWLMRGRVEKSAEMLDTALSYSERALALAPEQIALQFNVAFVAFQLATLVYQLPETQRSLEQVEKAAKALDEAIEAFISISNSNQAPFPRADIEQRANMGKNTMRKQLDRAIQSQREYEEKSEERFRKAREAREAATKKKEEQKRQAMEQKEAEERRIAAERAELAEKNRAIIEAREEEDAKRRAEEAEEAEMRRRGVKKGSGKRKKKGDDGLIDDSDLSDVDARSNARSGSSAPPAASGDERPRQKKKKRKLERKVKEPSSKYKSSEFVADSDDDDGGEAATGDANGTADDDDEGALSSSKRKNNRVVDDEEEEEGGGEEDEQMRDVDVGDGAVDEA